jgi:hypothetical protein
MATVVMNPQVIIQGYTLYVPASFQDDDGTALDMTSRTAELRIMAYGATTPTYLRNTSDSAEFAWTSQSGGTGTWKFLPTETFTVGRYRAEVALTDTSVTPNEKHPIGGPVEYVVRAAVTGAP